MNKRIRNGLIGTALVAGTFIGAGVVSAQTDDSVPTDDTTVEVPADDEAGHRGPRGDRGDRGERAAATAALLGIDVDELRAAFEDGQTLAEVADANGVDLESLISAQVAAATERINAAVESGDLTADEAADKLADLEERVTTRVNEGRPERGERGSRGPRGDRGERAAATAALLGIDVDELRAAFEDGQTLAEVADANGVDLESLISAQVAAATERINAAVESGDLTADEAADKLADLEERVTTRVNEGRPERGERQGNGPAD